jgi:hypothetical protein
MNIQTVVKKIQKTIDCTEQEASKIIEKSIIGGEISDSFNFEQWVNERFIPNVVFIDRKGYAKMCVDALKILGRTAPTDYGSSRQRDLGQLWADMTRGYLGEHAFQIYLNSKRKISCKLDHEVGKLQDFLPMDIHKIKEPGAEYRTPKIKLSIKTTKWNGIWLDIPGDQFDHSDIHVLVKVGAGRDHLFAFFKEISVFKDKVLKWGEDVGALSGEESKNLYNELPSFKPIPAYICGFAKKSSDYGNLPYTGKKGRKHYKILSWNGAINPGDLDKVKEREQILGKVRFEGIGEFAHDKGYLFNTGNLLWKDSDWEQICRQM